MTPTDFSIIEIKDPADSLLLPWLDLYEIAFPPEERLLVSRILNILHNHRDGQAEESHILAAVDKDNQLVGIVYDYEPEKLDTVFLWYIAIAPGIRGQGLGAQLYQSLFDRFKPGVKALIFDLEDPGRVQTEEGRELAERRIMFYRRQGARLLGGIDYVQRVGLHQPPIFMRLMIHPVVEISPQEGFNLAQQGLGNAISPSGELHWE